MNEQLADQLHCEGELMEKICPKKRAMTYNKYWLLDDQNIKLLHSNINLTNYKTFLTSMTNSMTQKFKPYATSQQF